MSNTKTLKVRIKDRHAKQLNAMARSVNFVWNYVNDLSNRSILEHGVFLSAYDIQVYTRGASKELGLSAPSIQMVGAQYTTRRKQSQRAKLRWRRSGGSRRSLGWIPFRSDGVQWKNGQVLHNGAYFKVWDSYDLSQYTFGSGSFNEDARGRWYFNVVVSVEVEKSISTASVGIDLGCKATATDSNGTKIDGREYRKLESSLGVAQKANKKQRVKTIHAKIKNRRADTLHKYSRKLVNENAAIFVGNVNAQDIAKTRMAKSSMDAGWGILRSMLKYKSDHAGIVFEEIDEAYTTQTCSGCGSIAGPRGFAGLNERGWQCVDCGESHDRDINAAINIRERGHALLAVGIIPHPGGMDVNERGTV